MTFQGRIKVTYEVITPESAEDGDVAERGWDDEEGTPHTLREAVKLMRGCEPSSSEFHVGVWYTAEGDTDYRTGAERRQSFHLVNEEWPEVMQRAVWEGVRTGDLPGEDDDDAQ